MQKVLTQRRRMKKGSISSLFEQYSLLIAHWNISMIDIAVKKDQYLSDYFFSLVKKVETDDNVPVVKRLNKCTFIINKIFFLLRNFKLFK